MVSIGCGRFPKPTSSINNYVEYIKDLIDTKCDASLDADMHQREYPGIHRLDPELNMSKPGLSDIKAIPEMVQAMATARTLTTGRMSRLIESAAWALLASMFYFELECIKGSGKKCFGIIDYQFRHWPESMKKLTDRLTDRAQFVIGKARFPFQLPCYVNFTIESVSEDFCALLEYGEKSASISGTGVSIENIIEMQDSCSRSGPLPHKRRRI